ncbi:S41 family peptidase [Tenacibaculum sp. UWU-22]|uniref:S41 family peptidase n=1 Tax=Tenacibaculum sp. UWU-22 TaxID=3234187 RepID=UPI0034DAC682
MNKNNLPIYLALAVIFGILIGAFFSTGKNGNFLLSKKSDEELKMERLINYIEQDYVDHVDTDSLLNSAITNILGKLDPHSIYIPKENLQAVTENMQGDFVGIGVQFKIVKDSITVMRPIEDGPSIKAGIKAGDRILIANNDTLYGKNYQSSDIFKFLKGKPDTKITLEVYRKSNDSLFTIDIKRQHINIKSVDVAYMVNDSLGYIKIDRFARNTYKEFKSSLDKLLVKGMKGLILDLRDNGGGFVDIANKIADEFLEDKKLIVSTKNNKGITTKSYATEKGDFEKGNLYVLIDENTASASEIVAGALQDNDKGIIIGRRSFGKGLVQEEMGLGDGSAIRLTIARYYTPTGRSIQKPYNPNNESSYKNDIFNRYKHGELFTKDSIKIVDSLQFKTPKGKIVYGGGGIIPDVFVPIDTTNYLPAYYYKEINNFAFQYVDTNRKKLATLTADEFINNPNKINEIVDIFLSKTKHFETNKKTKNLIKKYIKTIVASELYNDEIIYRVNQDDDKMIQKVLELESAN